MQFGIKGGAEFTEPIQIGKDESRAYTIGPVVEIRLPRRIAIETGLMYKRLGASGQIEFEGNQYAFRTRGHSLELPVIAKHYFRSGPWSPYAGAGVALRRSFQTADGIQFGTTGSVRLCDLSPFGAGPVAAAGVQFRLGHARLAPEIRFTRWNAENERIPRNANQLELLLGLSF